METYVAVGVCVSLSFSVVSCGVVIMKLAEGWPLVHFRRKREREQMHTIN